MTIQTSEEIDYIALAKQAGYKHLPTVRLAFQGFDMVAFAKLVAQHERERIKQEQQRCYVARGEAT